MPVYSVSSITQSFSVDFLLTERLDIAIYGGNYNSSVWPSDPTAMLSAINDALDNISELEYSAVEVIQIKEDQDAMIITLKHARYKGRKYLDLDEINALRALIATQLNGAANFSYSSVEGTSSQLGGEINYT